MSHIIYKPVIDAECIYWLVSIFTFPSQQKKKEKYVKYVQS